MVRADWTYELPPVTGDAVWLEEYLVYDRDGEAAGKIFAVLEHAGRRWLGIEREPWPVRHDRRAVLYEKIVEVDHENHAVHLSLDARELDESLELPAEKGVEQGGSARRVVDVPPDAMPRARDAGEPGPVDRPRVVVAPMLLISGTLTLMGAIALFGANPSPARLAWFAIPVAFFVLAAAVGLRSWALPWRRARR
ncbi:MAG TPA: hypothetical protein VFJ91_08865 [Gaiellaceae bacterium]|nr:hypothetical protein [Gaiellaceae bacterium]